MFSSFTEMGSFWDFGGSLFFGSPICFYGGAFFQLFLQFL